MTIYSENQWECFNWLSYAGGALIKVADSAGSTVCMKKFNAEKNIFEKFAVF